MAGSSARFRVLPDFLIIGAQKSGTSSLYFYLQQHPSIRLPLGITKEVHYFDLNFHRGESWYRGHFPLAVLMKKGKRVLRTFEATPEYTCHPRAAARIAQSLPSTKLILIVRNPIDRAFSHYNMQVLRTLETLDFEAALDAEAERVEPELERILSDPLYPGLKYLQFSYMRRGLYIDQIERYRKLFPSEQLMIIDFLRLKQNPIEVYREVLGFLGLPLFESVKLENINEGPYIAERKQMSSATRTRLQEFFREPNERLYNLLGRDLGWR